MSAKKGRPKKGEERPTVLVRMYADQAERLGWITRISRKSTAGILEEMTGEQIAVLYMAYYRHAEKLKAAEDEVRRETGQEPTPPLPPVTVSLVPVVRRPDGTTVPVRVTDPDPVSPPPAPKPKRPPRPKKS